MLSFYYQPDLCAGSFRMTSLVEHLSNEDVEIAVITTTPNRYASFKPEAPEYSEERNVRIYRIPMPKHESGIFDFNVPIETWTSDASSHSLGYLTHSIFRYFGKFPPPIAGIRAVISSHINSPSITGILQNLFLSMRFDI